MVSPVHLPWLVLTVCVCCDGQPQSTLIGFALGIWFFVSGGGGAIAFFCWPGGPADGQGSVYSPSRAHGSCR